jgi:hypothetical protein
MKNQAAGKRRKRRLGRRLRAFLVFSEALKMNAMRE